MKRVIGILVLLLFPLVVSATNANTKSFVDTNIYNCTKAQDSSINTKYDTYFTHCMVAKCNSGKYNIYYYKNNSVTCTNGNTDPFIKIIDNKACDSLKNKACSYNTYCTMVAYYDCSKKSNGDSFSVVTEKPTTTKPSVSTKQNSNTTKTTTTTTTTTTVKVPANTKLASLSLSSGSISFSSDTYTYQVDVDSDVTDINITAVPVENSNTVKIEGNTNIVTGSVISITVTSSDGDSSKYTITVNKKEKELSNNALLKSLVFSKYSFNFNPKVNEYNIVLNSNDTSIDDYTYETEDQNATVEVIGNENLSNGSKVQFVVTAENGETKNTYTINITKKKKSSGIKAIFIIILILAILAGAYYVYKKFFQGKSSGGDYEYE